MRSFAIGRQETCLGKSGDCNNPSQLFSKPAELRLGLERFCIEMSPLSGPQIFGVCWHHMGGDGKDQGSPALSGSLYFRAVAGSLEPKPHSQGSFGSLKMNQGTSGGGRPNSQLVPGIGSGHYKLMRKTNSICLLFGIQNISKFSQPGGMGRSSVSGIDQGKNGFKTQFWCPLEPSRL